MRSAVVVAVLLGPLSVAVHGGGMPSPAMNYHPPFYIDSFYWRPAYGIYGPTDVRYPCPAPVNGIGPPPFGPRGGLMPPASYGPPSHPARSPYGQPPGYGQQGYGQPGYSWHPYVRSPRDFFMSEP